MVKINKLEMQGFKSFSKKTPVLFPSNFSVVCGPNGSGKSNIMDAICFVLGRTSAKSLRAGRMYEMIFSGSHSKKPSEFAKVTLDFDNSDKKFPIEDDSVTISRTVNRKGISIYKLNGRTVTRETIQEVLRSANIHPDGHNIILQGDVTEIVEMSPIERREIIDEISGVMEFDQKREKAKKELMIVEDRLREAVIVLTEKKNNLDRLEKERKAAKEYNELTRELDKLRATLAKEKLEQAGGAMSKLEEKIKKYSDKNLEKELSEIDKRIDELEDRKENLTKRLFDRSKDIALIKEVENIKTEISKIENKIESEQLEIERLNVLISRLEELKKRQLQESSSRPVQEIIKLGRRGVYGTIATLSKVPGEYQTAFEVAAGSHVNDVIVSDENIAVDCVNHLKRNRIGRATFLPLNKIQKRSKESVKKFLNEDGVIGVAIDLIDYDKKYQNAFSFVFGDTLVVDKIETAKRLGLRKARYVTLDGDLIGRSGAILGGFYHSKKKGLPIEDPRKYVNMKKNVENNIKKLKEELVQLNKEFKLFTSKEKKETGDLSKSQEERGKIENELDSLRKKRRKIYDKRVVSQESINTLRIRKARLEAELDNIKIEFENYKKVDTYKTIPEDELKKRITHTITSINQLGPVNMKALEEYKDQRTVYDDLKEKVDKLTTERERVFQMMTEIEGRRKDIFIETLQEIQKQFKEVFKDLTGGKGILKLESDDIDSGLIIEATPAGRRSLNIDSMSGGEKTMTALAFLFSIQRFRPAPFYVLDEVDAALDKPNTKKVVELIKKYSDNAQFIIITHNDTTIQEADCVYGVSMSEGESNLIGIKMPS